MEPVAAQVKVAARAERLVDLTMAVAVLLAAVNEAAHPKVAADQDLGLQELDRKVAEVVRQLQH